MVLRLEVGASDLHMFESCHHYQLSFLAAALSRMVVTTSNVIITDNVTTIFKTKCVFLNALLCVQDTDSKSVAEHCTYIQKHKNN